MDEQDWYDAFAPAFQKMSELGYSSEGGVKGYLYEVRALQEHLEFVRFMLYM